MEDLIQEYNARSAAYEDGVLDGSIKTSGWIKKAVERARRDHKRKDLYFDKTEAARACIFFEKFLKHSKGKWAGKPFLLEGWQVWILTQIFGWMRTLDGKRKHRLAYVTIGRKNGKSTFAAGIALYAALADHEAGAEVYMAATTRDQARIVWNEAANMVAKSPNLKKRTKTLRNSIAVVDNGSFLKPVSSDAKTLDGLNTHCSIIDELHAHPNRDLYDVIRTSTGAREQPLIFSITTAGYDRYSICYEQHARSEQVLNGNHDADEFFCFLATMDEGDDWRDQDNWYKGNPNLGVSVSLQELIEQGNEAIASPGSQNTFLRLRLNVWTEQSVRWIDMAEWKKCNTSKIDYESLKGKKAWAGLDLSSTRDLTAYVLIVDTDPYTIIPHFFLPEDTIKKRSAEDGVPYDQWEKAGLVHATPGNIIDQKYVLDVIFKSAEHLDLQEVVFDRYGSNQISIAMQDEGIEVTPMGQGFVSMNGPSKQLDVMIANRKFNHGGHQALAWQIGNAVVKTDPAGNIKPDKEKATEKIDGVVALVMAIEGIPKPDENGTVYDSEELLFIPS